MVQHISKRKKVKEEKKAPIDKELRAIARPWYRKPTFDELFTVASLTLFESWGAKLARSLELDKSILKAGMNVHPVIYASKTIMITFITSVTVLLATAMAFIFVPMPFIARTVLGLVAVAIPILILAMRILQPSLKASDRKSSVENELSFFMAYASTMVKGGVSLEKIIERVSTLKVFKAMKEECLRVMTYVKLFGYDPVSALERVALLHPSIKFRDLMLGYTTTLRSGGDVTHYMEIRTQELFNARMNEVKSMTERLASFLELYIVLGVIMSITVFVLFSVSGTLSAVSAGRATETLSVDVTMPSLYSFVVLPLLGFVVLMMIQASQPKTPVKIMEPYITLIVLLPISVALFFISLFITGGSGILRGVLGIHEVQSTIISLTIAMLILTIPPWLLYRSILRGHKGLIKSTADYLREMSEIRKTGLSPEKCIIQLSTKDFRNLTPIVSKAGAALTLGLSLEEALRKVLRGIREWFVIAIFRFLTDSIVVGGGAPDIIDTLARFTQTLSELEEELRRRLKVYVVLPYFGAVMLASSPIIIVNMLITAAGAPAGAMAPLIGVLGVGSMINSFIMGLIAGKSSEMSVAAGFKHAALMTLVTSITLLFTLTYISSTTPT
ncbi:MAG: type II secretion system F family protein [Desulfurococcaceae archaeon TW002]